ncbi:MULTISPECIES: hypothetical protein [Bradyrhizobium]|uniref:hypothetical protein n=1 Tax=Bradyrhizobium TaxID=374 RepID=UPI000D12FE2E|nr:MULTISPECIES: hypothetical protein [Bradyrhizobium]PSO19509.1 hypothetical protein C7G42_14755 [Bradyrhizobium sp. MOS003]QDP22721.1 hypothetical protein FNV92_11380 [Bradyrhizobium cosmicum]
MTKTREFTRQELYDLVWTTPLVKLAKEFGLSDVGLRKTCVRHQVPTPPLGYWAKLSFGKPAKKTPLLPPSPGVSDRVLVSVFVRPVPPKEVIEAAARAHERISTPIVVPDESPTRLHPTAKALRQALRSARPDDEGFLRVGGPGLLVASLGAVNRERAWLIVDTLLKAVEAAGQQIKATDTGLVAIVDGETLSLRLGETKEKTAHQPTLAELKAKANWEEQHRKWPSLYNLDRRHWRNWDYQPSGRLSLTLTDPLRTQWQDDYVLARWSDRKASKLEAHLEDVLVAMLTGAATARHNRLAAEAEKRRREETHQAYLKEQERRRYEAQLDAFIEAKADELIRLQKIVAFRDHLSWEPGTPCSPAEEGILRATNDLISRLQHGLSAEALKRAVKLYN